MVNVMSPNRDRVHVNGIIYVAVLCLLAMISPALSCKTAESLPDLVLQCQGISILPFGEISLELVVRNAGEQTISQTVVEASIGEPILSRKRLQLQALAPGDSLEMRFTFQLQPDAYPIDHSLHIEATVDPENLLGEADESNNVWSGKIDDPPQAEPVPPPAAQAMAMRDAQLSLKEQVIEEALRTFPDELVLHVPVMFEVRITREIIDRVIENWRRSHPRLTLDIYVSTTSAVELTSSAGFQVFEDSTGSQAILDTHPGEWAFTITPIPAVSRFLCLSVSVLLRADSGYQDELRFVKPLSVNNVRIRLGLIVVRFLRANWKWIVTLVIGSGLGGVIIKRVRKAMKRRARTAPPSPPDAHQAKQKTEDR